MSGYTEKVFFIDVVQIYFIQRKQFSEINVTSHGYQQISDFKIFPECYHGPQTKPWQATCCPWACS